MALIVLEHLTHVYDSSGVAAVPALREVDLSIDPGEYVALVGANGSGKTTLGLHLNGLLRPTSGRVLVDGLDTRDESALPSVHTTVGMVFQSPADQIVGATVEDDVAFGPENLGLPRQQVVERVDRALELTGMRQERLRPPHLLSVGQQQRVAIAGVLAMQPQCIVLDEATSCLDPRGAEQLLALLESLWKRGTTIVSITHRMEEAARAQRTVVLHEGTVAADGGPREVLCRRDLERWGLRPPFVVQLAELLSGRLPGVPREVLWIDELVEAIAGVAR